MADNQEKSQAPNISTNTFSKGMLKDYNETFVGDGLYTHARNAVNNSHDGQVGVIGNEPSNLQCVTLPYTFIGAIHLLDDQWAVFTTDDVNSEIGIFDESACTYTPLKNKSGVTVDANCLGLKKSNLITGVFRRRYDCERVIYWEDGLNPSRTMDIDNPPCVQTPNTIGNCTTYTDTEVLDCEKLRIVSLIEYPCINISRGQVSGTLPNGTYQACIAYTINQVKVTDYIGLTNPQGLFTHENTSSSLEITITNIDKNFDEFELVLLTNINSQSVAKRIGYYNTSQGKIYVDRWSPEYVTVAVSDVVFRSEPIEKGDAMYAVNNYLLRVGTYSKFKFNYQLMADAINVKWVAVEYPGDYYIKGGNKTGYMRDEVYSFFIRWIYNTGERSESYHIPGRVSTPSDLDVISGDDVDPSEGQLRRWQVYNTATVDSLNISTQADGGVVIASGKMAYWESTERYPSNKPDVWGELCGKPIRHHKMPDETRHDSRLSIFRPGTNGGDKIRLLGVQFENILPPRDNNNKVITSIVGYEILRGSREGNKSIIAKGLINNMREYDIPGSSIKGLYQNYPFNDLRPDIYLRSFTNQNDAFVGSTIQSLANPLSSYKKDIFSFHSPETTFSNPYLNGYSLQVYQYVHGNVRGQFQYAYKHPKFKMPTDFLDKITKLITAIDTINAAQAIFGGGGGVSISATDDFPISLNYVLPPYPSPGSGAIGSILYGLQLVAFYAAAGAIVALEAALLDVKKEKLLKLFLPLVVKQQYAIQYNSYGFYNNSLSVPEGSRRRRIGQNLYIKNNIQTFTSGYQVNNLNRNSFVGVQVSKELPNPPSSIEDNTRKLKYGRDQFNTNLNIDVSSRTSSRYGALKISIPSQYGQIESIKQMPVSTCVHTISTIPNVPNSTDILFNGDVYINRFTEKNTMFFFSDWLMGEPDLIEYDYRNYFSIAYPRFWANSEDITGSMFQSIANNSRHLNGPNNYNPFFVKNQYFYLFNSGVRDFFVESEVNIAYRDWEEDAGKRHYDPYGFTDINLMFRSDLIKNGNYYKYDYSLSISKLFNSSISWGNTLPRDYNPLTYATCFTYRPNRVIYSLPQQDQSKKDNWRVFLPNNYKDFSSSVTSIKQVNKTGALFMMKYMSPLQFMGVEELKLDTTGAKITIGDSGLFTGPQQLQSIVNADESYEYASNQGKFCSINTIHGIFWVSQNQGKVFNYAGQLNEISNGGLKWWFAKYLPSELLKAFPDYKLYDNPVIGVGVQMIYDNTHEIVYITKKDYKPKSTNLVLSSDGVTFLSDGKTPIELTNTDYFEEASFTVSYDPKSKSWVSFHDWVPTFLIPGRAHFLSVKNNSIWKHNVRCDNYCNFYGVDYPFEIEFISTTGQTVNTIRSVEYLLEAYRYHNDCKDKFHVLDENFDQAMIYNSEQISGILQLNIKTKNNPLDMLTYPRINTSPDSISIQFSKEENKYRFNQFWDITKNRGEYNGVNIPMFNTAPNGYVYPINPSYVDYSKPILERKKFRHNVNRVFLRRFISGENKLLFKISNQKLLNSPR